MRPQLKQQRSMTDFQRYLKHITSRKVVCIIVNSGAVAIDFQREIPPRARFPLNRYMGCPAVRVKCLVYCTKSGLLCRV